MSHWTKGKFRQREPPPALFVHGSPTASNVSLPGLAGNAGAVGNTGGGTGSAGGPVGGSAAGLSSGGSGGGGLSPALPPLQRTTSRLRQEVAGSTLPLPVTPSGGGVSETGGGGSGGVGGGGIGGGSGPGGPTSSSMTAAAAAGGGFSLPLPLPLRRPSSRATDRADSLWAEMQATLEEVELSASEGTRVFGPDHDSKLAELRQAQIALAQAWARSEADDTIETMLSSAAAAAMAATETARLGAFSGAGTGTGAGTGSGIGTGAGAGAGAGSGISGPASGTADGDQLHATMSNLAKTTTTGTSPSGAREDLSGTAGGPGGGGADGSTAGTPATVSAAAPPGSAVSAAAVARMDAEETQVDILLARKRREANDLYFQRVSRGVLDVVAKLDDVAAAMRAVEQESKDMFGDNEIEEEAGAA